MTLVSSSISNLVGGVSQQPSPLRLPSTGERVENAWPSVVTGLMKRPPTEHVAFIEATIDSNVAGYLIERDDSYRYMALVQDGDLKVIDLNSGLLQTVNFPDGKSYLNTPLNANDTFRFVTFGDFTFIANRSVSVIGKSIGEFGATAFVPSGTVTLTSQLPSNALEDQVWKVSSTDAFYKWTRFPYIPPSYVFVDTTGITSSPPLGYTESSGPLPTPTSSGQKLFKEWLVDSVNMGDGSTTEVYGYVGYTSIVKQVSQPEYFQWVQVSGGSEALAGRLDPLNRGVVYVTASVANSYYSIYISGNLRATYLSPTGTDANSSVPDTATIAGYLKTALENNGYNVTQTGSTLVINDLSPNDTILCNGTNGDKSIKGFRDAVQSFSDLPPNAPEGLMVRVQGDLEEAGDDYYVIFKDGNWEETYAFGSKVGFDETTMPHVLVRDADGTWTFRKHVWGERECGDDDSNKYPAFVGRTINDIFVYTNRLGFLSDENLILSESDNFENFFRTTTAQTLDTDRIDIAVLHNNVDILQHAVPFNRDLLLMSNANQFRFSYANFLSAKNSQVRYTTSFNVSSRIRPVNMGASLYFVDDRADYSYAKVMEYYPRENVAADDADDVTAPVPEYIPNNITFMAASTRSDCLIVGAEGEPSKIYLYKFYWNGERKIQTSWNSWNFPDTQRIHWATFSGTFLYILIQRASGDLYLERIKVDEDVFTGVSSLNLLMDRRSSPVSLSYSAMEDKTTITLPWVTNSEVIEVVSTGEGVSGYRHVPTRVSNYVFTVDGDISNHQVTVGIPYTFLFEFSKLYARQAKGQSEVVLLDARLHLKYVVLEYHDTAYFQVNISLPGRDTVTTTFNGRTVGGQNSSLGIQHFATGFHRIPVMCRNTDLKLWVTNDSPFPSAFGTAEWQGELTLRSRKRI